MFEVGNWILFWAVQFNNKNFTAKNTRIIMTIYVTLHRLKEKKLEVTAEGPNVIPRNLIKIQMPDHIILYESHFSVNM